jgi:hypothetical protein
MLWGKIYLFLPYLLSRLFFSLTVFQVKKYGYVLANEANNSSFLSTQMAIIGLKNSKFRS